MPDAHNVSSAPRAAMKLWTADTGDLLEDLSWLKCTYSQSNILEIWKLSKQPLGKFDVRL